MIEGGLHNDYCVSLHLLVYHLLASGAVKDGVDLDDGYFVVGPELPEVSSSAARKALIAGDESAIESYLHPAVIEWHTRGRGWDYRAKAKLKKAPTKSR